MSPAKAHYLHFYTYNLYYKYTDVSGGNYALHLSVHLQLTLIAISWYKDMEAAHRCGLSEPDYEEQGYEENLFSTFDRCVVYCACRV